MQWFSLTLHSLVFLAFSTHHKAWAFQAGGSAGRETYFRKDALPVKFTKYHQHWELMKNKDVSSRLSCRLLWERRRTARDLPCWSASSRYSFNDFYLSLEHRVCSDTDTDKSIKADAICHGNYQDGSCFSSALSELCINGNSGTGGAL